MCVTHLRFFIFCGLSSEFSGDSKRKAAYVRRTETAGSERGSILTLKEGEVLEEFYGDRKIIQNVNLYRFTSDSILLSRFARAKVGDRVADFCAGSGVVGFHFYCLNGQISGLTLFEMQQSLADMARRTAELNGFPCEIVCTKLQEIGREYDDRFSLILCNPPYERSGFENVSYEKAVCRKEITLTLPEIVETAYRKLKFGGRLAILNRADRTAELLYLLKRRGLEPKRMQFVSGTAGAKPYLVMAEAVKGGKEGVDVLPTFVNERTTSYGTEGEKKLAIVREEIQKWDPYGLLAGGCPRDEFESEVASIAAKINEKMTLTDLTELISDVFMQAFDDSSFSFNHCKEVAEKIYQRLHDLQS